MGSEASVALLEIRKRSIGAEEGSRRLGGEDKCCHAKLSEAGDGRMRLSVIFIFEVCSCVDVVLNDLSLLKTNVISHTLT